MGMKQVLKEAFGVQNPPIQQKNESLSRVRQEVGLSRFVFEFIFTGAILWVLGAVLLGPGVLDVFMSLVETVGMTGVLMIVAGWFLLTRL